MVFQGIPAKTAGGRVKVWSDVFRCAACNLDCSGEAAYVQHLGLKSHVAKAGWEGYAGLLPNDKGVIPTLSPWLLHALGPGPAEAARAAVTYNENQPAGAAARKVAISSETEEALQAALQGEGLSRRTDLGGGREKKQEQRAQVHRAVVPLAVPGGGPLAGARQALPAAAQREVFLRAVAEHQVVIVEGETGSGKTTQIPQFLLEAAAASQTPCSVICTQPRRLAASSVAERIAAERGEPVGQSVGYSVRMESRASAATRLLLVTTGVLLRRMESDIDLEGTTHVVVDEVHERAVDTDFLLLLLRDLCGRRPDFRVVLMSATFEISLFAKYFGDNCPVVKVSGRLHPVEELYLEDALQMTGHVVDPMADWAWGSRASKNRAQKTDQETKVEETSGAYDKYASHVGSAMALLDPELINYGLLVQVILNLSERPAPAPGANAILVFLPGAGEIHELMKHLLSCSKFGMEPMRSWVLPLHGALPPEQQRQVFQRAPQGVTKVVCCTNVAETSITVDDVGFVVDSGRMKEMRYDPLRRMSSLEDCFVTKANARQRRGRAGRIAPGVAVHLFTRYRHDSLMDSYQKPEVQRVPLEQLILRIVATIGKNAGGKGISTKIVCLRLIEPPAKSAVERSVADLVEMEALCAEGGAQRLTALGEHLASLPVDARIGKLILLGAAFGPDALDKSLTVAAALSCGRSVFYAPLEKREEANMAQRNFAMKICSPGMESDHLAVLQAYMEWERAGDKYNFCQENFLGFRTMQGISQLKQQLLTILSSAGFAQKGLTVQNVQALGARSRSDGVRLALACEADARTASAPLMAALLFASLFPRIISVTPKTPTEQSKKGGKKQKQGGNKDEPGCTLSVRQAGSTVPIAIHPSSVNAKAKTFASPYLVYGELVQTSRLFAREVTPVHPLAMLLFGSNLGAEEATQHGQAVLTIAGWIRFCVTKDCQALMISVRAQLDQLLQQKIEQPDLDIGLPGGLLQAVAQMLSEPPVEMENDDSPHVQLPMKKKAKGNDSSALAPGRQSSASSTSCAAPPRAQVAAIYWQYRWRSVESGETFGPFDGATMSAWQLDNLFTQNPADARRCSASGTALEEAWQSADEANFLPETGGLADLWAKNSKKQCSYIAPGGF